MTFKITFSNPEHEIIEHKYYDALERFQAEMPGLLAGWNNFADDEEFVITVTKIKETEALGVNVNEGITGEDIFGRA